MKPKPKKTHAIRNEKLLRRFAKNLKKVRKAKGMTQEDLAYKSGIALSQIGRLETGILNTSIATVFVLIQALGTDANQLFE